MSDDGLQLIRESGERIHHDTFSALVGDVGPAELRKLYQDLVVVRRIDAEATALQRQGQVALWAPLLGLVGVYSLIGGAEGAAHVGECREAKQRGAEIAEAALRKAEARAEAETEWKRAYAAARADDCATVRALDPQIRALDVEFHDVVFMRDVGIARCLVSTR